MDRDALLAAAWSCQACPLGAVGPGGRPSHRFPPVIGRRGGGPAPLLFVGINPRVSTSNRDLHAWLVADFRHFRSLADNRVGAAPYLGEGGQERHYRAHQRVAAAAFPGEAFEEVAAVTELFLCATETSPGLVAGGSPCADRFLTPVLTLVQPRVVLAVGRTVGRVLGTSAPGAAGASVLRWPGGRATVIEMPHPNARGHRSAGMRAAEEAVQQALRRQRTPASRVIRRRPGEPEQEVARTAPARPPVAPPRSAPEQPPARRRAAPRPTTGPVRVIRTLRCDWKPRYGWRPHQQAAHLQELAAHAGGVIRFELTKGGRLRYIVELTAEQWTAALGDYASGDNWQRYGLVTRLTRTRNGAPTEEFLPRWAAHVRPADGG